MVELLSEKTAELSSLAHFKGHLKVGYDADFVIWDPDSSYTVSQLSIYMYCMYVILILLIPHQEHFDTVQLQRSKFRNLFFFSWCVNFSTGLLFAAAATDTF